MEFIKKKIKYFCAKLKIPLVRMYSVREFHIRRSFLVVVLCIVISVAGCGHTDSKSDSDYDKDKNYESQEKASDNKGDEQDVTLCNSDTKIPVYSSSQKKQIKKYLASLPDDFLSAEDAAKLGIIMSSVLLSESEQSAFDDKWTRFFQDKKNMMCPTGEADAIVVARYTTEGDPIYQYLSFISGDYYLYVDYSRDRYGSNSKFVGNYQEIRRIVETKEKVTSFYLVQNFSINEKEFAKLINNPDFENDHKIYQVYEIDSGENSK